MKILVTGGAGYIGSIAVKKLLSCGHEVVVFDNLSTGNRLLINKNATFVEGDLLDPNNIRTTFSDHEFDAVMHFAGLSQVGESVKEPQKYFTNNVMGSLNLLKAMLGHCDKIIFSSSAAIFGQPDDIPITEDTEKRPTNPYGISKLVIEDLLDAYDTSHGIHSISLRYFNAAGADSETEFGELHDPETHLIPLILQTALNPDSKTIKIFGTDYDTTDGTCIRDYIHVEDLVAAHVLALDALTQNSQSKKFNLGSEKGFSVREIIEKCKEITGVDFRTEETERREGDPAVLIASSKKIKEDLRWKPRKSIDNIIQDAWEWTKKQQ